MRNALADNAYTILSCHRNIKHLSRTCQFEIRPLVTSIERTLIKTRWYMKISTRPIKSTEIHKISELEIRLLEKSMLPNIIKKL